MTVEEKGGKTILVVDDEESIRFLYREELEDEGYRVITASDGEEALRKLRKEKPDLVTRYRGVASHP